MSQTINDIILHIENYIDCISVYDNTVCLDIKNFIKTLKQTKDSSFNQHTIVINKLIDRLKNEHAKAIEHLSKAKLQSIQVNASSVAFSSLSLLSFVREGLYEFFCRQGFLYFSTPDVDTSYYVFDALNMHEDHVARSAEQTFYCKSFVLRPHTTSMRAYTNNVQKAFYIGTVYRRDNDARHIPAFTQIDVSGVCGKLDDLFELIKSCILYSWSRLASFFMSFHQCNESNNIEFRFRKHYFPYTCPSFEIDMKCTMCMHGCFMCSHGWIEIAGCGIFIQSILPKYLQNSMVMAFGMGIERLTSFLCCAILKQQKNIQSFYL